MRLRSFTFAFALAVPFLTAACSGVTGVERKHSDSACADLYDAYATWSQVCLGTAPDARALADLSAHCAARAALPGAEVSDDALWSCADAVAASPCAALPLSCLTPVDLGFTGLPRDVWLGPNSYGSYELLPRVQGTLPTGAACDIDHQCQSGSCSSYASCGVCLEERPIGEACDETSFCAYGGICQDGICVAWGDGLGAPCQAAKGDSNCQKSLYCQDGFCAPRLAVGDPCPEGQFSEACPHDARCVDGFCKAHTIAREGEGCDDAATCEEGTFCVEGECHAPVDGKGEGDICGIDLCAPGLVCSYGVCKSPAGADESCAVDVPCAEGLFCDDLGTKRCLPLRVEGEPCDLFAVCAPGFACYGVPEQRCHRGEEQDAPCDNNAGCRMDLACRDGICAALDACSTGG